MDQKRSLKDILLFCTFLSGWAALTYEILWVRLFSLVFGHTTFAISTVLAAFMAGLALGSWAGGRWADSGKWNLAKAYAVCEIGIGVFGLLSKHLIRLLEAALVGLGIGQWFFWWQSLGWFIVLFLLLLPPTFFMGATLPILVVWAKKTGRSASQNMAVFYGVNTAGASLGTLAAGLWLASELGITWTLIGAVFLNVLAAALAWRVAQLERGQVLNYAGNGVRSSFVTCYNKLWPPFSSCQQVT
ncbi:MAG: fused MFS/spermidine synthase, partial [Elusimicrobia bacterium]|nr:fused MFS/spermidine synthase [Elusimicrobiota bacterium]